MSRPRWSMRQSEWTARHWWCFRDTQLRLFINTSGRFGTQREEHRDQSSPDGDPLALLREAERRMEEQL